MLVLSLVASSSSGQNYVVLHRFTGSDGANPQTSLILAGTTLYGTTPWGGSSNAGTLFKLGADGSGFAVLKHFTGGNDGAEPLGRLVSAGPVLYGTTHMGGLGGGGTVFTINSDGSAFALLHSFTNNSDAFWPDAGLVLSGSTLYGTTTMSGAYGPNYGTVFKMNVDGSGYAILKTFGAPDGANPAAEMILAGTNLYGDTSGGDGTVFKLNTDGSAFAVLKQLNHISTWNRMNSPLVLSGTTLYGVAAEANYYGTVFKINTDGAGYTVLKSFTNSWGAWKPPGLAGPVLSGSTLYGTTSGRWWIDFSSATNEVGTVFQVNTDGSGYRVIKTFEGGADGATPDAALLAYGTTLFGVTWYGGISNNGVVFVLGAEGPGIGTPSSDQTVEAGTTVNLGVEATGSAPLWCHWYFNGTNLLSCSTNRELVLTNVQFAQAGPYTVVVTNLFGMATSAPTMLNVISPVDRRLVPGLVLKGEAGKSLSIDVRSRLGFPGNWLPLDTVSLVSTSQYFFDLTLPLSPQGFYRAWHTNAASQPPVLYLNMVPALTLTGAIGSSVRIDHINQSGPIDAWSNLATVTLTNTSQLYFDTSSIGQPPRLWRIVPVP